MKNFLSIIAFALLIALLCACARDVDEGSSASADASSTISEEYVESSSEGSDGEKSDEASGIFDLSADLGYTVPEFNPDNVIYNPENIHVINYFMTEEIKYNYFGKPDKASDKLLIYEITHFGLDEYINASEVPEDAWFCVSFTSLTAIIDDELEGKVDPDFMKTGMHDYLDYVGVIKDTELTDAFGYTNGFFIGYITKDMLLKICNDGNGRVIAFTWMPKECIDAHECIITESDREYYTDGHWNETIEKDKA
ncbi:MAG: hypothetical protein IKK70_03100 [Clostridia bacterium]|nr:hypothetical protein [Clostridia bacterium]